MTAGENVAGDRGRGDGARPRTPLDPVREHDETTVPFRRRLDEVAGASEHAAAADRRAVRLGSRRAGPRCARHDERQAQRDESDEGAAWRHAEALAVRGQHRGFLQ